MNFGAKINVRLLKACIEIRKTDGNEINALKIKFAKRMRETTEYGDGIL